MSRPRRRDSAADNSRSASAPPLLGQLEGSTAASKRKVVSRSSSRVTDRKHGTRGDGGALTACGDGTESAHGEAGKSSSSTASPVPPAAQTPPAAATISRALTHNLVLGLGGTDPQPADDKLPSEGDFVEGGVEISPTSGDEPRMCTPRPCGILPVTLEDPQLDEYWPSGDGQRALFLDYDGTLREFESRPELATVTQELDELLSAFNDRDDVVFHIISGRDANFLELQFGKFANFTLIAEHGFQIWRPSTKAWNLWDHPDGLDRDHDDWKMIVREEMSRSVSLVASSFIEEKASSLVWHYRLAKDQSKAEATALVVKDRLEVLREKLKLSKIRVSHGHKVVEVSYRKVRKGPVMRRICEEKALFGHPFLSVLVAGDDVSDESMFGAAPDDFLTIKVGDGVTLAKFRVDTPATLREFLWQCATPPFPTLTATAQAASTGETVAKSARSSPSASPKLRRSHQSGYKRHSAC